MGFEMLNPVMVKSAAVVMATLIAIWLFCRVVYVTVPMKRNIMPAVVMVICITITASDAMAGKVSGALSSIPGKVLSVLPRHQ